MLSKPVRRPIRSTNVAARVYGNDAVIISPEEGMVRMLNPTATRIWQLADGSRSVEDIAVALAGEFEVDVAQAQQSVTALLEALTERQLVTWVE